MKNSQNAVEHVFMYKLIKTLISDFYNTHNSAMERSIALVSLYSMEQALSHLIPSYMTGFPKSGHNYVCLM